MASNRKLPGLMIMLIAIALGSGVFAWVRFGTGAVAPLSTVTSGGQGNAADRIPQASATAPSSSRRQTVDASAANDADGPPSDAIQRQRIAVAGSRPGRPCEVVVTVVEQRGDQLLPQPFCEVGIGVFDTSARGAAGAAAGLTEAGRAPGGLANERSLACGNAITDALGQAVFTLTGGAQGHLVRAISATGGRTEQRISSDARSDRGEADGGEADRGDSSIDRIALTIRVAPRTLAVGRTVDATGRPVADATIVLVSRPNAIGPNVVHDRARQWQLGTSDARGRFTIGIARPGTIGATHEQHAPSPLFVLRGRGTAGASRLDGQKAPNGQSGAPQALRESYRLVLQEAPATITGTVRDHSYAPVRNAVVEIWSTVSGNSRSGNSRSGASEAGLRARGARHSVPQRVRTATDGSFVLRSAPVGSLTWSAVAVGHGWMHGTLASDKQTRLEINLPRAGIMTGIVRDGNGRALAGAKVIARAADALGSMGSGSTRCAQSTRSARDGSFRLVDLGAGPIELFAMHGEAGTERTLDLVAGAREHILLKLDERADGRRELTGQLVDASDRPLSGWTIVVRSNTQQTGMQKAGMQFPSAVQCPTAEDGSFRVPVSQPAGLDVRALPPGQATASFSAVRRRNVNVEDGPIRLVVETTASTSLRGQIQAAGIHYGQSQATAAEASSRQATAERADAAASEMAARIECWHVDRKERALYQSDASGLFEVKQIPVGRVVLTVRVAGHVRHRIGPLELQAGIPVDLGTIDLQLGGSLYGQVTALDGSAPEGLTLQLLAEDGPAMRASYQHGSYRFDSVPAGPHTLVVQGAGIAGASFAVRIEAGVDLPRNIELQRGIYRRIQVRVPAGAGERVTIALQLPDAKTSPALALGGMRWFGESEVVRPHKAASGTATFETWMAAGDYQVSARTARGFHGNAAARYAPGGGSALELTLKQ